VAAVTPAVDEIVELAFLFVAGLCSTTFVSPPGLVRLEPVVLPWDCRLRIVRSVSVSKTLRKNLIPDTGLGPVRRFERGLDLSPEWFRLRTPGMGTLIVQHARILSVCDDEVVRQTALRFPDLSFPEIKSAARAGPMHQYQFVAG